jgi:hypothetical protein
MMNADHIRSASRRIRLPALLLGSTLLAQAAVAGEYSAVNEDLASMLSTPAARVAAPGRAQTPATTDNEAPTTTETWLRLQANGLIASPQRQSATPREQELANQRFLDSYLHPIPASFFDAAAGSSGSGNALGR